MTHLLTAIGCICTQNSTEIRDGISKEIGPKTVQKDVQEIRESDPQEERLPATDARGNPPLGDGVLQTPGCSQDDRRGSNPADL